MSDAWTVRSGTSTATFDLDGARMTELVLGGHQLLVTEVHPDELWWGALTMAPWTSWLPGARFDFDGNTHEGAPHVGADAVHGFVRTQRWHRTADGIAVDLDGWKLGGRLELQAQASESTLALSFRLTATMHALPAALGWHPWFRASISGSPRAVVALPPAALVQDRGPGGRPNGLWRRPDPGPWDDCFRTCDPVGVHWEDVGTLTVRTSGDFVTVFDQAEQGVCVEPVTSPAELMTRRLDPGDALILDIGLEWTPA